ncbi:hypothetical protein Tco_0854764, partial [Tanacetum coccineum]
WQSQAPRHHVGAPAQTRSERVLEKPNEPPLPEGHTSRSGESRMEHQFELTANVPVTPHDSPLLGGYTPGSDEEREGCSSCGDPQTNEMNQGIRKTKEVKQLTTKKEEIQTIKKEKAKEKGVAIKDVEDSPRPIRSITTLQPLLTIDPKDKGKGVLVEEEPEKPVKQEEATSAALAEEFDEIQARIDADHELAVRLTHEEQEKYTIEERARLLAEFFERRKKQLQEKKWIDDFKTIDDDSQHQSESTKKRPRENSEEESSKKQKLEEDNDAEKEELRDSMDVFPRDDVAIDFESLATKYLIVNWKTHILNENMMYYQINRADGSSKNYKIFSEMLDDFDRQDVIDLHRSYEAPLPEGNTLGSADDSVQLKELMVLVPKLVTRINSLDKELKDTKQKLGNVVLKLVKKVKTLETALKRKSKQVLISESEGEESETGEEGVRKEKSTDKSKRYMRRARSMAKKIDTGLDVEEEINTGKEEINTGIEEVSIGSTKFDSSTASERGQKEGKAPMVEEDIQATHKTKEQMRTNEVD